MESGFTEERLDSLFSGVRSYRSSTNFRAMMKFCQRMKVLAPYNPMLAYYNAQNKRMKTDKERIIDEINDDIELNESRLNNIYSTPLTEGGMDFLMDNI